MTHQSYFGMTLIVLLTGIIIAGCTSNNKTKNMAQDFLVYVGTYTNGESEGIYLYRLNTANGELTYFSKTTGIENPSFLAIRPGGNYLYSVSQVRSQSGDIFAYRISPQTGELIFLNKQSSEGAGPCHVSVDHSGKWVLAANYTGGTVSILPIMEDGSLGSATDVIKHHGSSVNPDRQKEPHPHSIWVSPDNRFAFVPDLGMDKIMIYKLDLVNGKLLPNDPPFFKTAPGSGPRHFTFHPSGKFAFVISELASTITSMKYDSTNGALTKIETVSTLPAGWTGESYCADIHTSPDGKFVYGSNRGHNSIAVFSFGEKSEKLSLIECEPVQGDWPRNFAIDPGGTILLAANKKSNNVVTFWIDQKSGELTPTGHQAKISMPVCLKLIPVMKE
ncbi:MAG: beta-propeller fold lactonase family protein [Actinobacteria bacterium]|nr:beta-propeller fold lactonase family protein [Actinomycetota bacterium]